MLEKLNSLLERETREFGDMNLDAMAEVNRLREELTKRIEEHTGLLRQAISAAAFELGLAPDATLWDVVSQNHAEGNSTAVPGTRRCGATSAGTRRHGTARLLNVLLGNRRFHNQFFDPPH